MKGIRCPICHGQTKVVESRPRTYGVYRRHQCLSCTKRFTTRERIEDGRGSRVRYPYI